MLWGTTGTAQTLWPGSSSPYWIGFLRISLAAGFFVAFNLSSRGSCARLAIVDPSTRRMIFLAGGCIAAYNLAFFAGVKATGVAAGTVVAIGSGPLWAGVLQAIFFKRSQSGTWWMGTLLAVAGGAMMVAARDAAHPEIDVLGLSLCLAAGLSYASYTLLTQRLVQMAPPTVITMWTFVVAGVIALPAAAALSEPFSLSIAGWGVILYLGFVATGISYLLFGHALQHISGSTGVTLALAEPLTAFLLAVLVVDERPTIYAYGGLAMALLGLFIVMRGELQFQHKQPLVV